MSEVIIEGKNDFIAALRTRQEAGSNAARNIVTKGALIIATTAKEEYRARPSGSRKVSARTGRVYYAGAPNYPALPPNPTIRSGATRNSIRVQRVSPVGKSGWSSWTGPSVKYAQYPEFGTKYIHIPFPVMALGVKDSEDRIAALAEAEWAEAVG